MDVKFINHNYIYFKFFKLYKLIYLTHILINIIFHFYNLITFIHIQLSQNFFNLIFNLFIRDFLLNNLKISINNKKYLNFSYKKLCNMVKYYIYII